MRSELKVELKSLPQQGLDFSYNEETKELSQKLKPLIGENNYHIEGSIRNEGASSYSISGSIQTHLDLSCARCAYEFKQPLYKNFKEKILLQKKLERIDKSTRNNHFSELMNEENFTMIESSLFDLGEFLYELVAVEEPLRPLENKSCDEDNPSCKHLKNIKQQVSQRYPGQIHFSK